MFEPEVGVKTRAMCRIREGLVFVEGATSREIAVEPSVAWKSSEGPRGLRSSATVFDKVLVFVTATRCARTPITPYVAPFFFAFCAPSGKAQCLGDRGSVPDRREGEDQQLYRHGRRYNWGRVRFL